MTSPLESRLEVSTPERVTLSVPLAGVGSRSLAYAVDLSLLFFVWIAAYFIFTLLTSDVLGVLRGLSGLATALLLVLAFAAQWLYWTVSEVVMNGQTLGKRVAGIRVVRLDGSPVGLLESALRNLLRALDFLPFAYALGLISILLTPRQQRLGDLIAGTVLMRDEGPVDLARYTAPASERVPGPVARPAARSVPPAETELILSYLERAPSLEPAAQKRLLGSFLARYAPAPHRQWFADNPTEAHAFLRSVALGDGHG